ncbi:MAG: hypothetical protein J0H67_04360 [Rhodospirillales bacterium]|nr:hypothetical protein [Rhodospirillales bacterium]MBN8898280.1 hypothetical protein [Rhodospirillales bacterium]
MALLVNHDRLEDLRDLTPMEFRQFGMLRLGYLREEEAPGLPRGCAILAADGSTVAEVDDIDQAVDLAAEHALTLLTVH